MTPEERSFKHENERKLHYTVKDAITPIILQRGKVLVTLVFLLVLWNIIPSERSANFASSVSAVLFQTAEFILGTAFDKQKKLKVAFNQVSKLKLCNKRNNNPLKSKDVFPDKISINMKIRNKTGQKED